jgi:hypothetical protein
MFARLCQFAPRPPHTAPPDRTAGKLRPASHSYLHPHREPLVLMTIAGLCAALVYAGVWLIRLLG